MAAKERMAGQQAPKDGRARWFAGAAGALLGLTLLKFGNPVIMAGLVERPTNWLELVIAPWPVSWGYTLLALVALSALPVWQWETCAPKWALVLPAAWLCWEVAAGLHTVDVALSKATLKQFTACVVWFYLGVFALARVRRMGFFWLGLCAGFAVVLAAGWQQHFGGLEETRKFFYQMPNWQSYPPEFIKKVSSDRIYSTLFYPNTLAGVIVLLLPVTLAGAWRLGAEPGARVALTGLLGAAALACLYWSGSKAGWLILLGVGLVWFMNLEWPRRLKLALVAVVLAAGLTGFFVKYAGYFARGATSVGARFDYWRAAAQLLREQPVFGTGPGTFAVGYKRLKAPDAEMAKLAHNDYLQQGSDSGLVGLVAYGAMILGSVGVLYRKRRADDWAWFPVWLGVCGAAVQGFVEFGLFIPAVAWLEFLFLGWLWGTARNDVDKENPVT